MMGGAGHDGGGPFPGMRDAELAGRAAPGGPGRGGADTGSLIALVLGVVGIAVAFVAAALGLVLGLIGGALALRARSRVSSRGDGRLVLALAAFACDVVAVVLAIVLLVR